MVKRGYTTPFIDSPAHLPDPHRRCRRKRLLWQESCVPVVSGPCEGCGRIVCRGGFRRCVSGSGCCSGREVLIFHQQSVLI